MATLNRAAVVTGYINKLLPSGTGTQITDSEQFAVVNLKFTTTGTPSGGESFIIDIIQNTYNPNPPPTTPMRISLAFVSGAWVCSYPSGGGAFNPFQSSQITIPPDSYIQCTDVSGGKMGVSIIGTMFRNFSN